MTKPCIVRNEEGLYRLRGAVEADVIVQSAANILLEQLSDNELLTSASDAAHFLQMALANEKNEQFAVLFLDKRHRVLCFEKLFTGTIDSAVVHPRIVVQHALKHNSAAVILAHNHPSNDCEPSQSDRMITDTLKDALKLIDVTILDHFVVSCSGYISLAERGWV